MNLFTRNSSYYNLLKYLLFLLNHPVLSGLFNSEKYSCNNLRVTEEEGEMDGTRSIHNSGLQFSPNVDSSGTCM